ncbi:MAG: DUF6210 family protein [Planctomycetota bacterium]|nr:DUF6210 family protein [Planctomycetota bacterium]
MPYVFLNPDGTKDFGLAVIVEHTTGVTYGQQCAGYLVEEQTLEGFLIPVGGPDQAKPIFDWFWKRFHGKCYKPQVNWTNELITELRGLIEEIPCWLTVSGNGADRRVMLELDVERIDECVEAWIPVKTPYGRGILALKNSD